PSVGGGDSGAVLVLFGLRPARLSIPARHSIPDARAAIHSPLAVGGCQVHDTRLGSADHGAAPLSGTAHHAPSADVGSLLAPSQSRDVLRRVGTPPGGLAGQHGTDGLRVL